MKYFEAAEVSLNYRFELHELDRHIVVCIGEVWRDYRSFQVFAGGTTCKSTSANSLRTGRENSVITQILISNARVKPSSEFTN